MTISKEVLFNFKEKYEKSEKLIAEESKLDPPAEPYKSHYKAKTILLEILQNVKNDLQTLTSRSTECADDVETLKSILTHIAVDLGKISNFTEEISTAEKYLNESIDLVHGNELNATVICAYLSALNEIGIIWMNRGETEKSKDCLIKAGNAYNAFKEKQIKPFTIHDILGCSECGTGEKVLEKINVLTLFYLAQVYGSLGDAEKSAVYCHSTLLKQLILQEFEPIDWALNAATLSQYFCTNNRYTEARHHLAAATQIMLEYERDMIKPGMTDDEKKSAEDDFNHRLADVNRCWVKYGLNLMSDSRERLLQDSEETGIEELTIKNPLTFGSKIDSAYENVIVDRYLLDMDDARPVFLTTQKWIEKAKSYYTAETEATEYSKIIQDHALAYKHLAFFESDPSNQAKMHKRRIDLLEDLLKILNKVFYMNIVREILYELGTAYSNILDIKLEAFEESQRFQTSADGTVNPQTLKKINDLITKSRNNFNEFIATYYQGKTENFKPDLSVDELIPIAFAYFQVARISYKFHTPDKQLQFNNLSTCLEKYQKFIALCDTHKEIGEKMKAEAGVSKEMAQLLPLKLLRIRDSIGSSGSIPAISNS